MHLPKAMTRFARSVALTRRDHLRGFMIMIAADIPSNPLGNRGGGTFSGILEECR
jgi:hypothetical protein